MRAWVIKAGKSFVDTFNEYGPLKTAYLFPTKKIAKKEILEKDEKVVSVEIVEVK